MAQRKFAAAKNAKRSHQSLFGSDWNISNAQKPPKNFLSLCAATKLWQIICPRVTNVMTIHSAAMLLPKLGHVESKSAASRTHKHTAPFTQT
jgi:hypothetical protein